jgi:diguanylate cyclase (GGDEF)-like protein
MRALARIGLAVLAFLLGGMAARADVQPLILKGPLNGVPLSSHVLVYRDAGRTASFAQVSSPAGLTRFRPLGTTRTERGLSTAAWWLSFTIVNPGDAPFAWRLESLDSRIDRADLYRIGPEGPLPVVHGGKGRALSLANLDDENPVFVLTVGPHRRERVFVRLAYRQAGLVDLTLRAWTPGALAAHQNGVDLADGILVGAAVMALIYNFILYLFARNRSFGWYFPYVLSATLLMLEVSGLGYRYLWPGSPFMVDWAYMLGVALTFVFALQFVRVFLDTARYVPVIDRVMRGMMVLGLAALPLTALGARGAAVASLLGIGMAMGGLPLLGLYVWRKGRTEARTFALVWCAWSASVLTVILRMMGVVPTLDVTIWLPRAGVLLESTLLSFAMLDQIATLRRQKRAAEATAQRALERSRSELEHLVRERTRDLEEAQRRAEQLALTDPLTGIDNRRAFFMRLTQAVGLARRYRHPLSVAVFDIDYFKQINDTFGHAVGDMVIQTLAGLVREKIRTTDLWARIGGEEFALAFPETSQAEAAILAEALRTAIQATPVAITTDGEIRLTVSIGIAQLHAGDATGDSMLGRADRALYRAKEGGRNRVELDDPGLREVAAKG